MKQTIKILVLEDNPDDLFLFQDYLESAMDIRAHVMHAETLARAIDIAADHPVDVAVLDLQVPDSVGIETFETFHQKFPMIPTIIFTGNQELDMAIKAVQHGAQDYILKGELSPAAMVRMIRHAIERQRLLTRLTRTQDELKQTLAEFNTRETEIKGLLKGARAVLEQTDFETTARKVFDICAELIGASSGYVALLTEDGLENDVLFLEAGNRPCSVDPELPMPIRGLRETAYETGQVVYCNEFMASHWTQYLPEGHVALANVLFAPLVLGGKPLGLIGLANKKGGFTENDKQIAGGFGELAAIALQNSRNLDQRDAAQEKNRQLIDDLKEALAKVKTLSGLVPICSHCKKIRDDQGYWNQLEAYIQSHSEAQFSHSICGDCLKEHYPDLDISQDA